MFTCFVYFNSERKTHVIERKRFKPVGLKLDYIEMSCWNAPRGTDILLKHPLESYIRDELMQTPDQTVQNINTPK